MLEAFEIFEDLKEQGVRPSMRTYNSLMGACVNAGQWSRAFEVHHLNPKPEPLRPQRYTLNPDLLTIRVQRR